MAEWQPSPIIDRLLGEVIKLTIKKSREVKFRVSSLPYCPIYNFFEDHHSTEEYPYRMGFYTNIGHAVHALMQEFIPHHDKIQVFGNWKCLKCGKSVTHKFNKEAKKQFGKCKVVKEKCWLHVEYQEIELLWKNLSGHTDNIWQIDGKTYLLDFKTTSSAMWRNAAATLKARKYPSDKYFEQIETYAALLYTLYKIKIDNIVIMYVGRDAPELLRKPMLRGFMRPFNKKLYLRRMARLERFNKQFELYKAFKTKPSKQLRIKLIKARPCHNATDYAKKMQARFEFSPCPNWSNYTCRTDAGVDRFLKDVALLGKIHEANRKKS